MQKKNRPGTIPIQDLTSAMSRKVLLVLPGLGQIEAEISTVRFKRLSGGELVAFPELRVKVSEG